MSFGHSTPFHPALPPAVSMSQSSTPSTRIEATPRPGVALRSAFLVSAWRRMAYALAAALALWALTGWALGWWPR